MKKLFFFDEIEVGFCESFFDKTTEDFPLVYRYLLVYN